MNPRLDSASLSARRLSSHEAVTLRFWFSDSASERTLLLRRDKLDDLRVDLHEAIEGRSRDCKLRSGRRLDQTGQRLQRASSHLLGRGHPLLKRRHRCVVGFSNMRRLQSLNLARARQRRRSQRSNSPRVLGGVRRCHGLEGIAERVGCLLSGAEGESLRLEVGVLDGQVEDVAVERSILRKAGPELLEQLYFFPKPELTEDRRQPSASF